MLEKPAVNLKHNDYFNIKASFGSSINFKKIEAFPAIAFSI